MLAPTPAAIEMKPLRPSAPGFHKPETVVVPPSTSAEKHCCFSLRLPNTLSCSNRKISVKTVSVKQTTHRMGENYVG